MFILQFLRSCQPNDASSKKKEITKWHHTNAMRYDLTFKKGKAFLLNIGQYIMDEYQFYHLGDFPLMYRIKLLISGSDPG